MAQKLSTNEFDLIIVGGGLSGLLFASRLINSQKKIALVDAGEDLGGNSKAFTTTYGQMDYELKFLPNTPTSDASIAWLEDCLDQKIGAQLIERTPQSYDAGKLKSFIGFGDNAAKSCHEINYYAAANFYEFDKTPKDWVQILKARIAEQKNIHIFNKSEVTALLNQGHKLSGVVLNAHQNLSAHEFIWTAPIHSLANLTNEENLPLRQKQKLAKTSFFASVHLDLIFSKKVSAQNEMLILQGANEEPLVGRFSDLAGGQQLSQWVCLIPNQESDSEELVASILKYMKRQITRVYDNGIMAFKIYERITLNNYTHGKLSFDREDSQFGKFENLWVSQASLSQIGNLLGCLEQSELAWRNYKKTQIASSELQVARTFHSEFTI